MELGRDSSSGLVVQTVKMLLLGEAGQLAPNEGLLLQLVVAVLEVQVMLTNLLIPI